MTLQPWETISGGEVRDEDDRTVVTLSQSVHGGTVFADISDRVGRLLGHVQVDNSVAVTGTFWQATQPVSATSLPLPTGAATDASLTNGNLRVGGTTAISATSLPLPAGAATDASLTNGNLRVGGTTAVSGTFFQTTQPVSVASLPLPAGAATDLSLTNGNLRGAVTVEALQEMLLVQRQILLTLAEGLNVDPATDTDAAQLENLLGVNHP